MSHTKANPMGWNFDNSYARLPELFYTKLNPAPVGAPRIAVFNRPLAASLGLDPLELQGPEGIAALAGNRIPDGAAPLAQAYAGHQFGYFNMLGDGRALLLGEQITPQGERFDVQLKGSGRTPYSRNGDGRAALGPMLREYVISEAMHALGIPTTRSLAVAATGSSIVREKMLPGAVLTRVAASHIRVGTFQYAAEWGTMDELRTLADYTLDRHYPSVSVEDNRYLALLHEVARRQADLIAKWQLVGFVHGVMNTDNMAISGETIDYGPCAFMDAYDPATVFSSIDSQGRYAYGNQPHFAAWNLARLAESLLPLLHEDKEQAIAMAEGEISKFGEEFQRNWLEGMRGKLGIYNEEQEDESLIQNLLELMQKSRADFTNTFHLFAIGKPGETVLSDVPEFAEWLERWQSRLGRQEQSPEAAFQLMRRSSPAIIPRNHKVEEALEAAENEDDYSVLERLLNSLSDPYEHFAERSDDYTMPSCSTRPYRTFCGT
ncbi:protein adenylyltransferase SelO [Cohnella terricola]|uniref:Protein nucleotidyltransferase YdiU n=1 Tax=Cohnella terricola TaxID=1289167 RepID=A0A559JQ62_9BACL|nr:YdiU family protein [Cohnella terricola]TVY02019.1 YdiU family protein [Cohnella terricola]